MSKFCGHCGTQMEESDKICGQCGQPIDGVSACHPKEKKRETVKLVVAGVIAIVIAVIAIIVILQGSGSGYKGLLKETMEAYETGDVDAVLAKISDAYSSSSWIDSHFSGAVSYTLWSFENSLGDDYKLSYKVDEVRELSESELSDLLTGLMFMYSFYPSTIEKVLVAEVTLTATDGNESVTQEITITMNRESGSWKLLYIE